MSSEEEVNTLDVYNASLVEPYAYEPLAACGNCEQFDPSSGESDDLDEDLPVVRQAAQVDAGSDTVASQW